MITDKDRAKYPQINFEQCLDEIAQYADSQMQVAAPGADPTLVSQLNQTITPLRKAVMASNIEFESYNERAKTASGIFYTVGATAALGYAMDYVPFLKPLHRFKEMVMSQVDDYGNFAGEIASVKGQGYSWEQVLISQWLAVPAALWANQFFTDLTFRQREPLLDKNGQPKMRFGKPRTVGIDMSRWQSRLLRGMKFGLACGILSIAASVSTLLLMFHQHKKLAREGKAHLPPGAPTSGWQFQWNSFKEAFKQNIQYPARVGLFLGSGLAIALTGLASLIKVPGAKSKAGTFLLSMTLVQALAGVGETAGAVLATMTGRKRNERRMTRIMETYIPAASPIPLGLGAPAHGKPMTQ